MPIWELLILSVALAADAATVSLSNTMCYPNMRRRYYILIPFSFAVFQGIMPLIGFFLLRGIEFGRFSKVLIFAIFLFLGGKMLYDALIASKKEDNCPICFTFTILLTQSLTTSIDAFAVGVSFTASGTEPFSAAALIAVVTFIICSLAVKLGNKMRHVLGSKAALIGGILLIALAIKSLI